VSDASTTGRRANRAGSAAESTVLHWCGVYRAQGLAWVERLPSDIRIVRAAGQMRALPVAGGLDFAGAISGGRHVAIEVKSASGPSLPLMRHGKPALLPQQRIRLSWLYACGALALILLRLRGEWVVLDWPAWMMAEEEAHLSGCASVSRARAEHWGASAPGGDWLTAARSLPSWGAA
jgi:hypothetical protein